MNDYGWIFVAGVGVGALSGLIGALPYLWVMYMDHRDAKRASDV